jgi:hypothetical protein
MELFTVDNSEYITEYDNNLIQRFSLNNFIENTPSLKPEERARIEQLTRGQFKNPFYKMIRLNRVTATSKSQKRSTPYMNSAMKYGIESECRIKRELAVLKSIEQIFRREFKLTTIKWNINCGIFLSKLGLFAASPDGVIEGWFENRKIHVSIEIKSPETLKDITLNDYARSLYKKKNQYSLSKIVALNYQYIQDKFTVITTHDHWRQMQFQMYCAETEWTFYIILSKHNSKIHVFQILRDEKCMSELRSKEIGNQKYMTTLKSERLKDCMQVKLCSEWFRRETFYNLFETDIANRLAKYGLFRCVNQVRCRFCSFACDVNVIFENVKNHKFCLSIETNVPHIDSVPQHIQSSYKSRLKTFENQNIPHTDLWAKQGFYYNSIGNSQFIKCYCCQSKIVIDIPLDPVVMNKLLLNSHETFHEKSCDYISYLKLFS